VERVSPSKSKAFYLVEQQDQEREDTQKEVVYLGNGAVILMMSLNEESVSHLFSASMSLGVPLLNITKLTTGVGSQSSTFG